MYMDHLQNNGNRKPVKNQNRSVAKGVMLVWILVLLIILSGAGMVFAISRGWLGTIPDIDELQNPVNKYASRVISDDGKLMTTWSYASQNRVIIPYDSIPDNLVKALVATEDERFYEHSGIDFRALGRAIVKTVLMRDRSSGGGSTITQQLAKQLYTDVAQSTIGRVLQKPIEWYIAVQLEKYYTKEEIIAMYFNQFDFLYNAVGIKNAARTYFGKSQYDLNLNECATLVGMCKNPTMYNPIRNNQACFERRNVVLQQMLKAGYIDKQTYTETSQLPVETSKFKIIEHGEGIAPYFCEHLRRILMATKPELSEYPSWQYQQYHDDSLAWETDPLYGWCNKNTKRNGDHYNIYTDGLKIYTTIDTRMQKYAEQAETEHVTKYLQPAFEGLRHRYANFPYIGLGSAKVEQIIKRYERQSERWRAMKESGASDAEIEASFNQKVAMMLPKFEKNGTCVEYETMMTPRDSILYYKKFLRTGMMAMDPQSGYVRAYVAGLDFKHFQYDNVLGGGRRQVGSTIKPYLYSLAVMNGWTPCDQINTSQFRAGDWAPRGGVGGYRSLASALAASSNQASARLIEQLGPQNFVSMLRQFGIHTANIDPTLSLCLGVCDISIGEMVSGYTAFANQGLRTAPLLVTKIEDAEGNIVATFTPQTNEVLSPEAAYQMVMMLRGVVDSGTARSVRSTISADMGGKTGTTNSNADGWFMGFTPKLVVGAWVGGDDRDIHFDSMSYGQGAKAALPIYRIFMNKVYKDGRFGIDQDQKFEKPEDFDPCQDELHDLQTLDHHARPQEVDQQEDQIDEAFQ